MEVVHPLPTESEAVPNPSADADSDRLAQLKDYFTDIATSNGTLDPATVRYIKEEGGGLRRCLREISQLSETNEADTELTHSRELYIDEFFKHRLPGRTSRTQRSAMLRTDYVDDAVAEIAELINASGPEAALTLRQMPTILENTTFRADHQLTLEDLAANHLYVLVDTALKEHAKRRELIGEHSANSRVAKVLGNRAVRLALAGSVFVASVSPQLHVIPIQDHQLAEHLQVGLEVASASVFAIETPEEVRLRYLDIVHEHRTKQLHEQLAESKHLSDLALRIAYSSTRYGGASVADAVTGGSGTDDKAENLRRFGRLDDEFKHLNNDPGGKPYTGDEALGYAARLLIERHDQLQNIVQPGRSPEEQKALYLELAREILIEDVTRMEKGLTTTKLRKGLLKIAGIVPSIIFSTFLSGTGDAVGLGRDVVNVLSPKEDEPSQE